MTGPACILGVKQDGERTVKAAMDRLADEIELFRSVVEREGLAEGAKIVGVPICEGSIVMDCGFSQEAKLRPRDARLPVIAFNLDFA